MINQIPEIKLVTDGKEWNTILKKIDCYDCYHTFEYHHLSKLKGELPILIYYEGKTGKIAFPLLKRKIPKYDFYDCTSVYGYVGPIFTPNIDETDLSFFQIAIAKFFKKEKIISVFSRLNPFLVSQEKSLIQLGEIETLGKVIFIDLRENNKNQRLGYSKTTKRYLNKSRKFCSIKKEFDQEDILIFKNLYYENMNRVNANSYYYFEESYFQQLLQAKEFTTDVKYVINNDTEEIIAGAIFIKSKHVIHYHLSGTKTEFLHLNPLRLLIDEMRLENSNDKEYAYFNLGGGLGNNEDDLYRFKSSFSNNNRVFKVWKYIVNQRMYDTLTVLKDDDSNFFPTYRKVQN